MKKRPEQTEQTKADLREAFWKLYTEKPIESISIQQITDLAGYNRGTFYLHYQDIYDLLEQIESSLLEDMLVCVADCMSRLGGEASLIDLMKNVLALYEENSAYIVVLLGERGDPAFVERLKETLKPLWRLYVLDANDGTDSESGGDGSGGGDGSESGGGDGSESGDIGGNDGERGDRSRCEGSEDEGSASYGRSEEEVDLILEYTISGALFMISRWLENPGNVSAEEILHLVYDSAIRGAAG